MFLVPMFPSTEYDLGVLSSFFCSQDSSLIKHMSQETSQSLTY